MTGNKAKGRGLSVTALLIAVLAAVAYLMSLPGLGLLLGLALLPFLLLLLLRKLDSFAAVESPPEGKLPPAWQGDGLTGGRDMTGL